MLDLHYVVAGVMLVTTIALVANMIWKITLMREENALLNAGKEVAV